MNDRKAVRFAAVFAAVCSILLPVIPPQALRALVDRCVSGGNAAGILSGGRSAGILLPVLIFTCSLAADYAVRLLLVRLPKDMPRGKMRKILTRIRLIRTACILVALALLHPVFALVGAFAAAGVYYAGRALRRRASALRSDEKAQTENLSRVLQETVSEAQTIRLYHREVWMQARILGALSHSSKAGDRARLYDSCVLPAGLMICACAAVLAAASAVMMGGSAGITPGTLAAALWLLLYIAVPA